jgi:transposase-like protein
MKTPASVVAASVSMYYRGMSISNIRQELEQIYHLNVSDFAIYNWIERFTKDAIQITNNYHPEAGYVWLADETVIDIAGKQYWLLDVIDVKTRFLLASKLSPHRWMEDIHDVLKEAYQRSGRIPKSIMTDQLDGYVRAIPSTFGSGAKHVQVKKFTSKPNNNIIERMQGTIKSRTKTMRDLKSLDTARLVLDGFLVHYNYMRPHEALSTSGDDITPAQKANINFPYGDWEQLIRHSKEAKQMPSARFDIPKLPVHIMTEVEKKKELERIKSRKKLAKLREGTARIQSIGRPRKWK